MHQITFYQRFEADILSGKKTITIRDKSEKDFIPETKVEALTHEEGRAFGFLKILSVEPIQINFLNDSHAQQENMSLIELKSTIQSIYPNTQQLFIIAFQLYSSIDLE